MSHFGAFMWLNIVEAVIAYWSWLIYDLLFWRKMSKDS